MAVANSLAAVKAGARQVECTVNGLGERAGNTSMEEVVMALKTRADFFGLETGIVTEQIYPASRLVSQITGIAIPINKPIVGENAFAHEAGIHQDGVLKNKITYEIMKPETVGLATNRLVLGKHSGRHAFVDRLRELGLAAQGMDMNKAFDRFKALADKKKSVYDEDLMAIVAEESVRVPDRYELSYLNVTSSSEAVPQATVRVRIEGAERTEHATGDGMVDACYKAIAKATETHGRLERYAVKAITGGTDAQGEVSCLVREGELTATGQGAHTDIIMASALAFLNALNKIEYRKRHAERVRVEGP
jgi:2-isopropylmalate synthase